MTALIDHEQIVRTAYPGARISKIGANTFRINYYEPTGHGICQTSRVTDTFLASVIDSEAGPIASRQQSPPKRIMRYSDKW